MAVEPKVFDLIAVLIENRDRVVSRDELIETVWQGRIVSESALASCINAARSAVGDSGDEQRLIKTLPRKGIRFVGHVRMVEERRQRRLAAVLAADVVGYSRLMAADEVATLAALKAHRKELIDPKIGEHGGRIVKLMGDGALVEFASVVDAVECAVAIQRAMREVNADHPEDRRIVFRIGVTLGDIIIEGDDIYGDGVNLAARLEGIAEPGGIAISEDAWRQVRGKVEAKFVDIGEQSLKNIERPVRVYRIELAEGATGTPAALALPDKPSIAVLPFQNMSGDPDQDYFADGTVEDIITGLSRIKWLFVIARNSSFMYKGQAVDVKQVGRELGVRYVLEGGVRKAGNRIRLTTQLIEAETGVHLWAERYDRLLEDIFAVQDEITMSVVGAIEPNLRKAEIARAKRKRPESLDAYDLVLRALPFTYSHTAEDAEKAIPLLKKALELEPGYATSHALLAWCYHSRLRLALREEDRTAAIYHAHEAVSAAADDATALGIAGFVISLDEHDHDTALGVFDRALTLSNCNIFALHSSALVLSFMGETEQAIERAQRALRLSPFDLLNYLSFNALAISYLHTGRNQEAYEAARSSVRLNPRFSICHLFLAAALVRLGRHEEARNEAREVLTLDPTFTIDRFSVTVGIEPAVFLPLAEAWQAAGLPQR
ncbi:MAG TPA: winged helix-turn-helix domain-containing protein [Stellaceae bacterium]|nr:winged helix-turn-helix domain-containing protein [Stellaceae bacterium]